MERTGRILAAGFAAAFVGGLAGPASAQDYPNKQVTFVVGFAAGGFADTVGRLVAEHVGKALGQTVVVENRAGAAGNVAARAVASGNKDGYTVLVATTGLAVNATMYKTIDYKLLEDLVPVAVAVRAPETFATNPAGVKTFQEFLDASKAKQLTFGSAGVGTGSHLTWLAFFKDTAKVNVDHVPFQGGAPAQQAAIGGQTDGFAGTASGNVVNQYTGGTLRCLAVASTERYKLLPDCPSLAELGFPGIEASSWVGFWVPAGTPADVVTKLNEAINSIEGDEAAAANLKKNGDLTGFSAEEAAAFVKSEVEVWGARVKATGAQVE